jgi:hypothetical protein
MTQLPPGHEASLEQVLGSVMRFFTRKTCDEADATLPLVPVGSKTILETSGG